MDTKNLGDVGFETHWSLLILGDLLLRLRTDTANRSPSGFVTATLRLALPDGKFFWLFSFESRRRGNDQKSAPSSSPAAQWRE
jgi:hypothetical protein